MFLLHAKKREGERESVWRERECVWCVCVHTLYPCLIMTLELFNPYNVIRL